MTRCEQVFNTTELLLLILELLDARTLLTSATRVCRRWNDTIAESRKLQQTLFLLPRSELKAGLHIVNPFLLKKKVPSWLDRRGIRELGREASDGFPFGEKNRLRALLREDASWRRMLVAHPPILSLGHVNQRYGRSQYHPGGEVESYPAGLRMGDLYGLGLEWAAGGFRFRQGFQVLWGTEAAREWAACLRMSAEDRDKILALCSAADAICVHHLPVGKIGQNTLMSGRYQ
ncbi:hypothetical protein BX600DRAFT_504331 [Xylariales sp. PMI_506]|nr:hypothetical protein BX600DRAFT_504331 [Xylariales sp. PMI_506]